MLAESSAPATVTPAGPKRGRASREEDVDAALGSLTTLLGSTTTSDHDAPVSYTHLTLPTILLV